MNKTPLKILLATALLVSGSTMAMAKGPDHKLPTFEELDADGSGEITTEDLAALRENRFAKIDADGNGSVTLEEFTAAQVAKASERAKAMFEKLDADGDGVLSRDVLESKSSGKRGAEHMLKRFDTDNSGGISAAEFEEAKAKLGKRRRGGRRGQDNN